MINFLFHLYFAAVGAFCKLNQDVTSWNHTEGAAVAIDAIEYERERDDCPMYFDDGAYPWKDSDASNIIFDWDFYKAGANPIISHTSGIFLSVITWISF